MSSSEAFVIINDWISEHYFTDTGRGETFQKQVRALRKIWDEDAAEGQDTPVTRFSAERIKIQEALASLSTDGTDTAERAREAYAQLRMIFGHYGQAEEFTLQRSQNDHTLTATRLGESTDVLWLDATAVTGTDQGPDQVHLLGTNQLDGTERPDQPVSKLLSELYLTEAAPSFIVVAAGNVLFLTDRERWPEGRYLAVDVQLVADRNEIKKGGEIDRLLAVFSRNSLTPREDGSIWWTERLEESHQHAVGVSQDLRDGIRESIEIIANDVLVRRKDQGFSNEEVEGQDLARQSLRFLYRILFLLYAEAFPELGVLPKGAGEYDAGYGIDRLRELSMVELTDSREQQGTHLYDSLALLFQLVNGDHPTQENKTGRQGSNEDDEETVSTEGLIFESLEADLFMPEATHLINGAKLGNLAMQQILQRLLLSRSDNKGPRGFISYANLGINQLGAVYEGLMSYTGFIAETDLREVAKNGDDSKGSWVVSIEKAKDIDSKHLVTKKDEETDISEPVLHPKGSFVFRLSGRERQQSASYYTPEVMTKFVVSQALTELLSDNTPADDILELSICEPALGSGAFVIEAVRQLADEYLTRKQDELGKQIEPENYARELQRVKAQIALHQVYGVDLNSTAVELAEVSLWLDTMQPGLHAPWFGLRLKRGNSLVGARRATYSAYAVSKSRYLTNAPEQAPLSGLLKALGHDAQDPHVLGRIHHFLLPAAGWGAAGTAKEVKELVPNEKKVLNEWAKNTKIKLTSREVKRLEGLAQRVETLWGYATRRLQIAEAEARRFIDYWPHERRPEPAFVTREHIEKALADENGAYRRLKRVMDAWCALWYWPLSEKDVLPPSVEQWIDTLEKIIGKPGRTTKFSGQETLLSAADWNELNTAEELDLDFAGAARIDDKFLREHSWLQVVQSVADQHAFFHWELDFAPVLAQGGFDLQVGNPPWVRPDWDDKAVYAEFDPWWVVEDKRPQTAQKQHRSQAHGNPEHVQFMLDTATEIAGTRSFLSSDAMYPTISGLRVDLYKAFMERTWQLAANKGTVALVHPESHFNEERAQLLRTETYLRLRQHWHFENKLSLYDISPTRSYGVHIYGARKDTPGFVMAASLYHPETAVRSLSHKGDTRVPGLKDETGKWDMAPHRERLIQVDLDTLKVWAAILEEPSTPPLETKMVYPINETSMNVLEKLSHAPRARELELHYSSGWNATTDKRKGYFDEGHGRNSSWYKAILQGRHFGVANLYNKEPLLQDDGKYTWVEIDLEAITADYVPATVAQYGDIAEPDIKSGYGLWTSSSGISMHTLDSPRLALVEYVSEVSGRRTLQCSLIPAGAAHLNSVNSYSILDGDNSGNLLNIFGGYMASLPIDFMVKLRGLAHITKASVLSLPVIPEGTLAHAIGKRFQKLNPLPENIQLMTRVALDRRQLEIELDVLVSLSLGLTIDELCEIYLTQFPVLQGYEKGLLFDLNGRIVPNDIQRHYVEVGQVGMKIEDLTWQHPHSGIEYVFKLPFMRVDRDADMRAAYDKFSRMLEEHGRIIEDQD